MTREISKQRQSNMELLRIVSMFLVLVVHADFVSLGAPSTADTHEYMLPSFMRFLMESLSIVCVNVFILLSGWFGICPSLKGIGNFLFQCFFFLFGIYVVSLVAGWTSFSVRGIAECFFMTELNWFIKAYIGLYILAPVINTFIAHSSEVQLRYVIVSFYIFQTLYAWISNGAVFFVVGYSTMSFIGLYLLARYVRLYPIDVLRGGGYLLAVIVNTFIAFIGTYLGFPWIAERIYVYTNPIVIFGALCLLLYFSKLSIQSKLINWIGASSFSVFLLHANPNIIQFFRTYVKNTFDSADGVAVLASILLFLVAIYIIAILIDQIRILLWKIISMYSKIGCSQTTAR